MNDVFPPSLRSFKLHTAQEVKFISATKRKISMFVAAFDMCVCVGDRIGKNWACIAIILTSGFILYC